jgi:ATP-dependent helicase/nuclease subunit B
MQLLALERARPAFSVRFAEQGAKFAIGGLDITLQPDRIDELATGGSLIIDYKLGASHRPRQWLDVRPGRPRRPQLPLYALAQEQGVNALAFAVLSPGKVEYRGWSSEPGIAFGVNVYPGGVRRRPTDPENWPSLFQHWQITLTQLAQQFVAGAATVDPLPQECSTCHLRMLCRVHERTLDTDTTDVDGNGDA